ncbi:hypothetical protein [Nonomuraea sp. NPDC050783]|uniref:hypothetical protein n=1 Tax=Nonomuraea sp. NPDC050783 TaxID=3154634 RepID=UPI003466F0A9
MFTTFSNAMLQRHDLSFVALGILTFLLSLPDGADMTVAKLEKLRKEGKTVVRAAVAELRAAGYYIKEDVQSPNGRLTGVNAVYDIPQVTPTAEIPPVDLPPVGEAPGGLSAVNPLKETLEKETPTLPPVAETPASEPVSATEAPKGGRAERPTDKTDTNHPITGENSRHHDSPGRRGQGDELAAVLPLFGKLRQADGRLTFSRAEMGKLAPLVAAWRERGALDVSIIEAVTAGLPQSIHSPAALVADRLRRKLPETRSTPLVGPVLSRLVECSECGRPGRIAGVCGDCRSETAPARPTRVERATARGAALARELMGLNAISRLPKSA